MMSLGDKNKKRTKMQPDELGTHNATTPAALRGYYSNKNGIALHWMAYAALDQ